MSASADNDVNQTLRKRGWLQKLGGAKIAPVWQDRLFILRGDILTWVEGADNGALSPIIQNFVQISPEIIIQGPKGDELKKAKGASVISKIISPRSKREEVVSSDNRYFFFSITDPFHERTWKLRTPSVEEGRDWLTELSLCGGKVSPEHYAADPSEIEKAVEEVDLWLGAIELQNAEALAEEELQKNEFEREVIAAKSQELKQKGGGKSSPGAAALSALRSAPAKPPMTRSRAWSNALFEEFELVRRTVEAVTQSNVGMLSSGPDSEKLAQHTNRALISLKTEVSSLARVLQRPQHDAILFRLRRELEQAKYAQIFALIAKEEPLPNFDDLKSESMQRGRSLTVSISTQEKYILLRLSALDNQLDRYPQDSNIVFDIARLMVSLQGVLARVHKDLNDSTLNF